MKAVLVIDMPSDCNHCQFADFSIAHGQWECNQRGESVCESMEICGKPSWCPLKPMLKKQELKKGWLKDGEEILEAYINGYNACIEDITDE